LILTKKKLLVACFPQKNKNTEKMRNVPLLWSDARIVRATKGNCGKKKRVVNDPQVRNYGPKMGGSGNVGENVWGLLAVKTVKM
jgi:hypothetical protein